MQIESVDSAARRVGYVNTPTVVGRREISKIARVKTREIYDNLFMKPRINPRIL